MEILRHVGGETDMVLLITTLRTLPWSKINISVGRNSQWFSARWTIWTICFLQVFS